MTAIEEMAGMDVLCSDKTGTLTLNKLTVDKNMIEVITLALCIMLFNLKRRYVVNLLCDISTHDIQDILFNEEIDS